MSKDIDAQIAELEQRIAAAKQDKLAALQAEWAELQGGSSAPAAAAAPAAAPARRGRPRKVEAEAPVAAPAKRGRKPKAAPVGRPAKKTRGGPRGPRIKDDDAISRLKVAVGAAGPDGISARQACIDAGINYIRGNKLMAKAFKKTGKGKWTRYSLK